MNLKRIYIVLFAVLLSVGCQRNEILDYSPLGNVVLEVETNSNTADLSVTTKASDALQYRLTIYDSEGEVVYSYDDCSEIEAINLDEGSYTFVAESGVDNGDPTIDAPYYRGESAATIVAAETTVVKITAKLANARVSAKYSDTLMDESLFSVVNFSIGDVVLTREMVEAGSSIFVDDAMGSFTWRIDVTNVQGVSNSLSGERLSIEECAHYTYSFDVDTSTSDNEGSVGFELIIDDEVTLYDDDIEINIEKKEAPVLTTVGFTSGVQEVVVDLEPRDVEFEFHFEVYAGTKEITIRHTNAELYSAGVPYSMELSEASSEVKAAANSAGISWTTPVYEDIDPVVSFTSFANSASLGEYQFFVELTDKDDQFVEGELSFVVVPDMDHQATGVSYEAKYAILSGEWCTLVQPEGLSFQYREVGESEWITVDESLVSVISEDAKSYSARVGGLSPLTSYEFRSYSTAVVYDDMILDFTTYDAPEIPNLSFDDGYWSSSTWYPNASGGNSYWATGNEGLTAWPVSSSSNTYHTDDAVSGKAVYMESVPITYSLSPIKFAAGNIYTGSYSTSWSDPASSAALGREYTGRPMQLKGYYKYYPQNIDNDADGVSGSGYGQADYCHIYISLENWGSATSRPSSPSVIGYGEFKTNETISEYSVFTIDIEYYQDRVPTHVVLTATSSHYGEQYAGGEGSALYIDEFELVWE